MDQSLHELTRGNLTRRSAIKMAAAATTGLVLSNFGDREPASAQGKTLSMLCWPGYEETAVISDFEKKNGVKIQFKTYIGGEQMLQFFTQSPPGTYDVVITDAEYVNKLTALKGIEMMPAKDFPDLANYHPSYQNFPLMQEGDKVWAVPARFGYYGISYNKNVLKAGDLKKWDSLLNKDFKDKVALFDWYLPNMGNASLANFPQIANPYDISDAQLKQVKDWMLKLKPNVSLITPNFQDIINAFVNEDVIAGPVGDWIILVPIADGKTNFASVVPEGGSVRWTDGPALVASSKKKDLAKEFIKYYSTPQVQARLANTQASKSAVPNLKAMNFMSPTEKSLLGYVPDPENPGKTFVETYTTRSRPRRLPVKQAEKAWQDVYNEFKTS